MKKSVCSCLFFLLAFCATAFAQDIGGFWKAVNEKTGKADCIVAVYQYQGIYYGRIIGTYNQDGVMDDTIYAPVDRAPGVIGNPFYCGLDFIWGLREKGEGSSEKSSIPSMATSTMLNFG